MRRFLALIAMLAVGCGGDESSGGPLSRADFTKRAEAICAERRDAVRELGDKQTPEGLEKAFGKELEEYEVLEPPAELETQWSRYVGLMEKAAEDQDKWMRVGMSGDQASPAFTEPYTRWQRNGAQARKLAKAMGLKTCGEHIY